MPTMVTRRCRDMMHKIYLGIDMFTVLHLLTRLLTLRAIPTRFPLRVAPPPIPSTSSHTPSPPSSQGKWRMFYSAGTVYLADALIDEPLHLGLALADSPRGPWTRASDKPVTLVGESVQDTEVIGIGSLKTVKWGEAAAAKSFEALCNRITKHKETGETGSTISTLHQVDAIGLEWEIVDVMFIAPTPLSAKPTWKQGCVLRKRERKEEKKREVMMKERFRPMMYGKRKRESGIVFVAMYIVLVTPPTHLPSSFLIFLFHLLLLLSLFTLGSCMDTTRWLTRPTHRGR